MKKKSKKPQQERETAVVIGGIILLVFGTRLVYTNISVGITMLSFLTFSLYLAALIVAAGPAILKNIRPAIDRTTRRWWVVPAAVGAVHVLYALVAAGYPGVHVALGLAYAGVMLVFTVKNPLPDLNWTSLLFALVMWLPVQLGWVPALGIPPTDWFSGLYHLTAPAAMLYIFIVVKNADIGFSLRLNGDDFKLIFAGMVLLLVLVVLAGFATQTIALTSYSPSGNAVLTRMIALILIVLPQELVFRGIVLNVLHRTMGEKKTPVALVCAALLFALTHAIPLHVGEWYTFPETLVLSGSLWLHVGLMFVCGLVFGWLYLQTRKLFVPVLAHFFVFWIWMTFFTTAG